MQHQPVPTGLGPGERAFDMAEQLTFDHIGGDGGTVDWNEWFVLTIRKCMKRPCRNLLPSSGLAREQNRCRQWGDALNRITYLPHNLGLADKAVTAPHIRCRLQFVTQNVILSL